MMDLEFLVFLATDDGIQGVVADDEVCSDNKSTDLFLSDDEDLSDDADWLSKRLFLSDDEDTRSMVE